MMKNKEYIKKQQQNNNHFFVDGIEIFIKDPISNDISIKKVINALSSKIPKKLVSNIKKIYVGEHEELEKRSIQAMYTNNSIYITNKQDSELDMLDDLIHEVAHSVEEAFNKEIYSDQKIKKEFIQKRKNLWLRLKQVGFEMPLDYFLKTEYDQKFDMFLYEKVGYKLLNSITADLFYSAYGATSLREYFANAFEAFFLKDKLGRLKNLSPEAYNKNVYLLNKGLKI